LCRKPLDGRKRQRLQQCADIEGYFIIAVLRETRLQNLPLFRIRPPFLGVRSCDAEEGRRVADDGVGAVRIPERCLQCGAAIDVEDCAYKRGNVL
jgi:hypothetical protein